MGNEGLNSTMHLAGELTIYTAAEQKEQLIALINAHSHSVLDLSGVTEVDAAGLQLLIMSKLEAARLDCKVEFINHSDAVIETIELCNLSSLFDDPVILSESARARA